MRSGDCSVSLHAPIRDYSVPLRGAGGGSRIGHTVSRAWCPTTASGPRPVSRSPPPSGGASMLHRTSYLYHDLLGAAPVEALVPSCTLTQFL
jgi:hypothetical protein